MADHTESLGQDDTAGQQCGARRHRRRRAILVVDDEPRVRWILAELLHDDGYHVLQAGSAGEAIRHLSGQADLLAVVTDFDIPESKHGVPFVTMIRCLFPHLPILTGSGRKLVPPRGLPQGVIFRPKPWQPRSILSELSRLRGPDA
ncbi:response regulator [Bordetella sp. 2513F-2]